MTRAYPRTIRLYDGREMQVAEVCYPFGYGFYRVVWFAPDAPEGKRGAVAVLEEKATEFRESSNAEMIAYAGHRLGRKVEQAVSP